MVEKEGKPTVLIVHNYYQTPGGEDTVVANEKRMLEKHGHKVVLYTRNNLELKDFSGLQKLMLPFITIFNKHTYSDVKKIIREQKIDILHVHNTMNLVSPSVYYAAVKCHVPVVQTIHNFRLLCPGATFYRDGHICEECMENGLFHAVRYGCYRGSRFQTLACVITTKFHRMMGIYKKLNYICLTEFNKEKLLSFRQITPDRVFVKPNFVESKDGDNVDEKRLNQFIFVGRLEKLKGIDILLQSWKMMGDPAPKLLICGIGSMEKWCRDYIAEYKLYTIEMKGFVSNKEARKLIADSKALILPTQWYEGFPMAIVEAFSVGTPVVTSDLGNAGSLVEEGVNGCRFAAGFPEELGKAIARIETYPDIHKSTEAEYKKKYSSIQNYKKLMEIYQEAGQWEKLPFLYSI